MWNENLAIDDLIGQVELDLAEVAEQGILHQSRSGSFELELDTGGSIWGTAFFIEPVSCDSESGNVFVGCKCVAGVHLEEDLLFKPVAGNVTVAEELKAQVEEEKQRRVQLLKSAQNGMNSNNVAEFARGYDARQLVVGTVIGFKKSDGTRDGKYPSSEIDNGVMVQWEFKSKDGEGGEEETQAEHRRNGPNDEEEEGGVRAVKNGTCGLNGTSPHAIEKSTADRYSAVRVAVSDRCMCWRATV
jgi:hypothetical protein